MIAAKVFGSAGLLVFVMLTFFTQVHAAAIGRHRRHQHHQPGNGPPVAPTVLADPAIADTMPLPTVPKDMKAPTEVFRKMADPIRPGVWRTPIVSPLPRPPGNPNKRPQDDEAGLFERFALRSAPMAPRDTPQSSSTNEPVPPSRLGVSDSVLWFFLASVGFFCLSLIWNLYLQFGLPPVGSKAIDARATAAMRHGNLTRARQDDKAMGGTPLRNYSRAGPAGAGARQLQYPGPSLDVLAKPGRMSSETMDDFDFRA